MTGNLNLRHGESRVGAVTPEYRVWLAMLNRCSNPKAINYKYYGGRDIKVCEQWINSYETFLRDMGRRPSRSYSLDRKDSNGHYGPDNCEWATKIQQARNQRNNRLITAFGQTKCMAEWAEIGGLASTTLRDRLNHGWDSERAITAPLRVRSK